WVAVDGRCCALAALLDSERSAALLRRLRGGSFAAGSCVLVLVAFDPDRAPKVVVNQAPIDDSLSAGAAVSIGGVRDPVATRVARSGLACASPADRERDAPPTFLRYQQRSFVAWLMR